MNERRKIAVLAAACLAAALATGAMFLVNGKLHAQSNTQPAAAAPSPPGTQTAPNMIPIGEVPYYAEWASSPHADHTAEAFNHWNKEGAIPVECARCHSTPGFEEYLGADGGAFGAAHHPAPIGTVITCAACHNDKARALTRVVFPSGLIVDNQGADARCMACHQGVESTNSVNKAIAGTADDDVNTKLEFINVHYRAAGATMFGTMAKVAYEYPGKTYAGEFHHREPYTRCTTCHELHTVAVKVVDCAACHRQVTDKPSLHLIRVSKIDYDGTGNADEGVAQEIDHLREKLLAAIMAYAKAVAKNPIVYSLEDYPYFFVDTNGNGVADKDETRFPNRYKTWTPRLLKAAYNYQFVIKDPGAFAHNPTYTIQILQDSINDLGAKVKTDMGKVTRP